MGRGKRFLWTIVTLAAGALLAGLVMSTPTIAQTIRAALVRDTDNPDLQPRARIFLGLTVEAGQVGGSVEGAPVPAGKRLVIETVSVFGYTPDPERFTAIWLTKNNPDTYMSLDPQPAEGRLFGPGFPGYFLVAYNRNVNFSLNAGESPRIEAYVGSTTQNKFANIFLHGYYVTQ